MNSATFQPYRRVSPLLAVLLLWTAGRGLPLLAGTQQQAVAPAPQELIWPAPPDLPRIRWEKQIHSFDEFQGKKKKKQSWFARIAGAAPEREAHKTLQHPWGVVADSRGRVLVADAGAGGIVVFDPANRTVQVWGRKTGIAFVLPLGLALDRGDRVFVTDPESRLVTCLSSDGEVLGQFGADQLLRPVGVAIDPVRRRLYVADTRGHRVAVFNADTFAFEKYIGGNAAGSKPGEFRFPLGAAVDQRGYLYVTDSLNYRVQVFDRRDAMVLAFGSQGRGSGQFARPKGIAVDSEGHIYVTDAVFNNFQIFDRAGRVLLDVGTRGVQPGQFTLINGIFVDGQDRIYTTEKWLPRVQIFKYIPQPDGEGGETSSK